MSLYKKRIADTILNEKLNYSGAILIKGPRWCGKTTTAKQISKSSISLTDTMMKDVYINLSYTNPNMLLKKDPPLLIDEWQVIPHIWDSIRNEVDSRNKSGQFILTGSVMPVSRDKYIHSGIGRIIPIKMYPMSLYESEDSNGDVSLIDLFNNKSIYSEKTSTIEEMSYLICRGGWPSIFNSFNKENSLNIIRDYYNSLVDDLYRSFDNKNRDNIKIDSFLKSYARNISTSASIRTLQKDIEKEIKISEDTIATYIKIFEQLFIIDELQPWTPYIRSSYRLRRSNIRNFIDPSIATAALNITPNKLMLDLPTFGLFFESLCIRDLNIYMSMYGGKTYSYHDESGLEVDCIVESADGNWGAVEIKIGTPDKIEQACQNLLKFKNRIDTSKTREPSFLMVLTATSLSYRRVDGIYVVSISSLKP